jgi:hypothetical protein
MYLSNRKYKLARLQEPYLNPAITLLSETFLSENEIWKAMNVTLSEVCEFMGRKVKEVLEWE